MPCGPTSGRRLSAQSTFPQTVISSMLMWRSSTTDGSCGCLSAFLPRAIVPGVVDHQSGKLRRAGRIGGSPREQISGHIDLVVGLPTLSLTLASAVAQKLGHEPLCTARHFSQILVPRGVVGFALLNHHSEPAEAPLCRSANAAAAPHGRRVALIDDVISSGASIVSGLG